MVLVLGGVVLAVVLFVVVEKTRDRLGARPTSFSTGTAPAPATPPRRAQPGQRLLASAPWGGVLLECGPNKLILFLLPIVDPEPYEAVADFPPGLIEAVVVLNGRQEGVLAGSLVARKAQTSRVFAVAPGPIDRGTGWAPRGGTAPAARDRGGDVHRPAQTASGRASPGNGAQAPGVDLQRPAPTASGGATGSPSDGAQAPGLDVHLLAQTASDGAQATAGGVPPGDERATRLGDATVSAGSDGVRVRWADGGLALVGDALPIAAFLDSGADQLAGAVAQDLGPSPTQFRSIPRQVVLLPNVPGADQRQMAQLLAQLGVSVTLAAAPPDPEQELIALLALGQLAEAEAMARARIARGALLDRMTFQLGIAALMRRDEAAAIAAFEAAAQAGSAEACSSLAGLLAARGDRRALDFAKRALDALPNDPTALQSAIRAHLRLGDGDGARALYAAHREALEVGDRVRVEAALDGKVDLDQGAHRFPGHAKLVSDLAASRRADGEQAAAEPLARRAVELDRDEPAHVAELGTLLSELGREAEAVATYDEAIARGGVHELLRFNRGNCHLRAARYPQAVADYRACLALKDDWHEVRVNLASALFASEDRDAARAELQKLKDGRAPGDFVAGVEQMLA